MTTGGNMETSSANLLGLPHEVLHHILTEIDPEDLGAVSRSCRKLNIFLCTNQLLYRKVYLKNWDNPKSGSNQIEISWQSRLENAVKLQKILTSEDEKNRDIYTKEITDIVVELLNAADVGSESLNLRYLRELFSEENKDVLLYQSSLYRWMDSGSSQDFVYPRKSPSGLPNSTSQLSAKLHCLYGVITCDLHSDFGAKYTVHGAHPYARSRVYDLRNHTEHSFWGPFHDDGLATVDWEKAEAIMIVCLHNLHVFLEHHHHHFPNATVQPLAEEAFFGAYPGSFVSPPLTEGMSSPTELDLQDPYGISGTYMRIVCFLDYTDFYGFNFHNPVNTPRRPRAPINTDEATRMITMRLQVRKIQTMDEEGNLLKLPTVHFTGTSSSLRQSWDPDANSKIRGNVSVTKEGEVRWTSWSIFHGEERWRSEGVQIGGIKSARGVLGLWFDKDFDVHGPAGPTAFWKVHDGIEKPPSIPLSFF